MTAEEFIAALQEELEIEEIQLEQETDLTELDEYDSMATLSVIALADEHFGKELSDDELRSVTTVKSLMELIGLEKFE
jgi:acyl carrier protein